MPTSASQTKLGPMIVVAMEQMLPQSQRFIQYELAIRMLPERIQPIVKIARWNAIRHAIYSFYEKRGAGVWGGVLCRKRYIEDRLLDALENEIEALVILGVGLDTLAYRLPALSSLPVYEVDLPENIAYKIDVLTRLFGSVPDHVYLVGLDFNTQDLASVMESYGYQMSYKTFFVREGVTQYLSADGITRTFDFLKMAGSGSQLVFTYICQDFIDGINRYGLDKIYQIYRVNEQIWQSGMIPDQVGAFLNNYGWTEVEQMGGKEYVEKYVKPRGRSLTVMEIERTVFAEKETGK